MPPRHEWRRVAGQGFECVVCQTHCTDMTVNEQCPGRLGGLVIVSAVDADASVQ